MNHAPEKYLRILKRLLPLWALACFLGWCWIYLSPEHSPDDADPEILNQAWRLAKGEPIYTPGLESPPYVHTEYTPVFYSLGALGLRVAGLSFLPTAFLSFLALIAVIGAFIHCGRSCCGSWKQGALAGCIFLLVPAVLYNSVRTHPQMLAVALALWGFVFFNKRRFIPAVVVSPLLAALSIYTKQTMIALPIASLIWLLAKKRSWFLPYLGILTAAGLAPLVWLQVSTGGDFWMSAVTLSRLSFDVLNVLPVILHHAGPLFLFLGLALAVTARRFRSGTWEPVDVYFLTAAAVTILSCGRVGAYTQYVVELCAAVLLYLLLFTDLPAMKRIQTLICIQLSCLFLYTPLYVALEHGPFALASRRASERILPLVRSDPGPMVSQLGSFALFGTGQIYIEMFQYAAFSRMGLWDDGKFIRDIEEKRLRWIITLFDMSAEDLHPDDRERFTADVLEAARRNYGLLERIGPYYVYRPLPPGE
ncbi:MAG: glycosyltransferase family 39 protein [Acidobacteria bacterium]|nr:glycosyltransferase family 39 protein [Acidobacteriota bacterium]